MDQINEVIDEKVTISKVLEQNKLIWMRSMIRMKGIQSIINEFQIQIKKCIQQEFKKNEDKIQKFMNVSRPPDLTIMNSAQFIQSCQGTFEGEQRNQERVRNDQQNLRKIMAEKKVKIKTGPPTQKPRYKSSNNRVSQYTRSLKSSSQGSSEQNLSQGQLTSPQDNLRDGNFKDAQFKFQKGIKMLRSFKDPKTGEEGDQQKQDGIDQTLLTEINYHKLASQVQNTKDLVSVVKDNIIPEDLPENIRPTDQWIESMAKENKAHMNSFSFKKKMLSEMHDKIWNEIRRKKKVMEMGEALKSFEDKVNILNNDACALFHSRDENKIRSKQPALIKNFYNCYKIEPHKADMMVKSKAIDFMNKWYGERVQDHSETISKWKGIWKVNERFEEEIMNEMKGHHLDLRAVINQSHLKYTTLMSKVDLRLSASEVALNQAKVDYHNRLNQLEMIDQDRESEELRQWYKRQESGGVEACEQQMESLINSLRPSKFQHLKAATDMLEKIKTTCKDYIIQQKFQNKVLSNMKFEFETAQSKMSRLEAENEAKTLMLEWIHELTTLGSLPSAPRAMMTQDIKKKLDIFKKESLSKQHSELLQEQEVLQKLTNEIQMSKIFSIVIFNIYQILNELSLFQSPEKFIRKNPKKFSMSGDQLFEIWNLFKNESVQQQMTILNKNRAEMVKFRMKMGEDSQKDEDDDDDGAFRKKNEDANKRKEAYFKRIQNEFNSLKESDFAVGRTLIKPLVKPFGLLMMQEDEFLEIKKSDALVEKLNALLVDESQSENEFGANFIKFHDLIKIDEQTLRVQIDPMKFPLFVRENLDKIDQVEKEQAEREKEKDANDPEGVQVNDIENEFLSQLTSVIDTVRAINFQISGKAYDKAVQFKPGRRLVEDDPMRGYLYLSSHSSKAPKKEIQCQILDAASIQEKIEKKLQRAFDLKAEKLKNRNKELDHKISKLKQELREQEQKLKDHGVSFEPKNNTKSDEIESHSFKDSEKSVPVAQMIMDDDMADLYSDIKKMTSVFSGAPGANNALNINELDNVAVFKQKIHNLDIFKKMNQVEEGQTQQIPLVTQKTKMIARKSFEKDTIGAVIMRALQRQIKKTIRRVAQEQRDKNNLPNISPNQPSRHTITIANRSAFANTPLDSPYLTSSSDSETDFSLSQNNEDESTVRMTKKPKKRHGQLEQETQTELTGQMKGSKIKDKKINSEQFANGQTPNGEKELEDSSRPDGINADMIIEEQITGRTLLDDASKIRQNNGSLSSDLKHIDKVRVGKWGGTTATSISLSKDLDPSFLDVPNYENLTTEQMRRKCRKLISSFEMEQILLREKYEIFPQEKKLKPKQYHNIKDKLNELQKVQDTISARREQEALSLEASNERSHEIQSTTISPRIPYKNAKVVVQLDKGLSQMMRSQNLNPSFNIKTQFQRVKIGSKLAQSLNISRASKLCRSPNSSKQAQAWTRNNQQRMIDVPQAKADANCSPMNIRNGANDKDDSEFDIDEANPEYLHTIPSINKKDPTETQSTPIEQQSQKNTNETQKEIYGTEFEAKQVNFYQYPAKHIRKYDGSTSKKGQRNEDIRTVNKLRQHRKAQKKKPDFNNLSLKDKKPPAQQVIINIEEPQISDGQIDKHNSSIQDMAITEHVDTPKDGVVILPIRKKPSLKKLMDFNSNDQSLTFKLNDEAMSMPNEAQKHQQQQAAPQDLIDSIQVDNPIVTSKLKKSDMSLMSQLSSQAQRNHLRFGTKQVQTTKHSRPQYSSQTGPGLTLESNQHDVQSRPSGMKKELFRYYQDKSSLFVRNLSPVSDMQMIGSSYHLTQKKNGSPNNHSPEEEPNRVLYANQRPEHYLSNIAPKSPDFSTLDMKVPPSLLRRDPKKIQKKKSEAFYTQKVSKQIEFSHLQQKQRRTNNMTNTLQINDGIHTQNISRLLKSNYVSRDRQVMSKSTVSSPIAFP